MTVKGKIRISWLSLAVVATALCPTAALAGTFGAPEAPAPQTGIRVRVLDGLETSFVWLREEAGEVPAAIRLSGARGGCFSGRLEVSSPAAIRGLKVEAGELVLAGGGGKIPAAAVRVRYAEPAEPKKSFVGRTTYSKTHVGRFDALMEKPPAEVPVRSVALPSFMKTAEWHFSATPGAVQPVWVTVRVPADAAPGDYAGKVTIRAAGLNPTEVSLSLKVADWRVPDPGEFTVHHNIYQSHDSVALHYGVPLWSDKHFELMGRSLELAREVGNGICVVHLIAPAFCMGNQESMVRWVRKKQVPGVSGQVSANGKNGAAAPDTGNPTPDTYTYDFTVFDRYLDLYAKIYGKPRLLLLSVWARGGDGAKTVYAGKVIDLPASEQRPRMKVSLLDPATGKVAEMEQPPYGTPESVAFWKPVLAGVRQRLEKRGWWNAVALGHGDDAVPLPATVAGFQEIWPDARWMSTSHMNPMAYKAKEGTTVPVGYSEHVWGAGWLYNPGSKDTALRYKNGYPMPWKRQRLEWGHPRIGIIFVDYLFDSCRMVAWRFAPEAAVQGNLSGVGRIGIDFFPPPAKYRGYDSLAGDVNLGPAYSNLALLYPGPDGPMPTERFEMFREGNQVTEAIIRLRRAMDSGRLGAELAGRCSTLLDERARRYYQAAAVKKRAGDPFDWKVLEVPTWQESDARLFALAGEVSRVMGGK